MIQLKIDSVRFELDKQTKRYVRRKIGRLDRFIPKNVRSGLHAHVTLIENTAQPKERFKCEVRLHLPHDNLFVNDATVVSMHAAIDEAEAKLTQQLLRYKTRKMDARRTSRRFSERLRRFGRD